MTIIVVKMLRMSRGISSVGGATNEEESVGKRNVPPRKTSSRASTTRPSSSMPHFQLFVYDTELLRSEWDDPASAVIFTHPATVPAERKLAIAGTLAGVFNFFEQLMGDEVLLDLDARAFWIVKWS